MARPSLHVAKICTGKICQSPMVEAVLRHLIAWDTLLKNHVFVTNVEMARWQPPGPALDVL